MNRSNLKYAFRRINSQKTYFSINLFGLISGISAFILIVLWVNTEFLYDNFQNNAENIYRVDYKLYEEEILEQYSAAAVPVIGPRLTETYPEVEEFTRFRKAKGVIGHEDVFFNEDNIFHAESSFFSIFNFPLKEGTAINEILDVNKAVITETTAKRYFGNENPIGKYITHNGIDKYYISAVAKDSPNNSHIKFDILLSYENLINNNRRFDTSWLMAEIYTYVRLVAGADSKALENKIPILVEQYLGDFMKRAFFLVEFKIRPLDNIHLHSNVQNELGINGNIKYVRFMSIIAILVLLIAFINYINLLTSISVERSNEVGVRKVLGALRKHLMSQFLSESLIVNVFAILFSLVVVLILLPSFRNITGSPVGISKYLFAGTVIGLFLISSLITGIIPAAYLSNISSKLIPGRRDRYLKRNSLNIRSGLIIFQFSVSVILIIGTLIIGKQISFLQKQDLGIQTDQILVVEGPKTRNSLSTPSNLNAFKNELKGLSSIKQVTISTNVPGEEVTFQPVYGKIISGVNTEKKIRMIGIDQHFMETYDLKFLSGKGFDTDYNREISEVIINESALVYLGFDDVNQAIGQELTGTPGKARIIGVIGDYNQKSLHESPGPLMFCNLVNGKYFSIKLNMSGTKQVISVLEDQWNKKFPGNPLNYFFLNDYINKQYRADKKFGNLFMIFSILAIIIACLGLLGLSKYSTTQRTKEIGIRKVNGANIAGIITLLNKDFIKWVAIAFVVACPIAYYIMTKWLENFAYKTTLSWWVFALAGVLALGIALLTVSFQSYKAATRNPIESLRYE